MGKTLQTFAFSLVLGSTSAVFALADDGDCEAKDVTGWAESERQVERDWNSKNQYTCTLICQATADTECSEVYDSCGNEVPQEGDCPEDVTFESNAGSVTVTAASEKDAQAQCDALKESSFDETCSDQPTTVDSGYTTNGEDADSMTDVCTDAESELNFVEVPLEDELVCEPTDDEPTDDAPADNDLDGPRQLPARYGRR